MRYANHLLCAAYNRGLDVLEVRKATGVPYVLAEALEAMWHAPGDVDVYKAANEALAKSLIADDTLVL